MRLIAAVLLVSLSTGASAGPKEEAFHDVLEQWIQAFNTSDVEALVKLHTLRPVASNCAASRSARNSIPDLMAARRATQEA